MPSLTHPDFSFSGPEARIRPSCKFHIHVLPQQFQIPDRNVLTGLALLRVPPWSCQLWPGRWGHMGLFHLFMDILLSVYYTSDTVLGPGNTAINERLKEKNVRQESKVIANRIISMSKTKQWAAGGGCILGGCLESLWRGIWIKTRPIYTWLPGNWVGRIPRREGLVRSREKPLK